MNFAGKFCRKKKKSKLISERLGKVFGIKKDILLGAAQKLGKSWLFNKCSKMRNGQEKCKNICCIRAISKGELKLAGLKKKKKKIRAAANKWKQIEKNL